MSEGFPDAEYELRWSRVLERIEADDVDVMAVTTPRSIQYLTGHDAEGAYTAPYALIVGAGVTPSCVVRAYNLAGVRAESIPLDLIPYFGRRDMVSVWADTMKALSLDHARVGLELDHWGLAPADVELLRERLPRASFVDRSRIVTSVAEVKSPAELEVMRRVAGLTDVAVEAFYASIVEGSTERAAAAAVEAALVARGSTSKDMNLLFGDRTALPHGRVSDRRIAPGDVAFIEVSGYKLDYAVGLCRTAVLGRNPEAEALHDLAEQATEAALDAMRAGVVAGDVDRAARDVVERAGRGSTFLQRTGYAIGLGWYDRGYMSLEPGADDLLEDGATFHLPRILFDEGRRFAVGVSESVLVTANGVEIFSRLPRSIHRVDP